MLKAFVRINTRFNPDCEIFLLNLLETDAFVFCSVTSVPINKDLLKLDHFWGLANFSKIVCTKLPVQFARKIVPFLVFVLLIS